MTRGGKRTGAGRPSGSKSIANEAYRHVTLSVSLPQYLVDWVKRKPNASRFIAKLLEKEAEKETK